MPRLAINYENSVVYKICCKDINISNIYIGSTTNFTMRKSQHKRCCNFSTSKAYNYYVYQIIRENGGWENWDMIEIEKVDCDNSNALTTRERFFMDLLKADLNICHPNRTGDEKIEYMKQYNIDNFNHIKENKKEYFIKNAEKMNTYQKEYSIQNAEKIKATKREYNIKNSEHIKAQKQEYRIQNAEMLKAHHKEYCIKNAEKRKAYQAEYRLKHKTI